MSSNKENPAKEKSELNQATAMPDLSKFSTIKEKLLDLAKKHEGEEIIVEAKKTGFPERESEEFQFEKKLTENENSSINNSSVISNFNNLSESVVKILDKFNSQNSISSIDFDKKKSKLKDYEVSAFPEENEEEYSEENDNDINLYTNIDKLMNNCPSLNEGEFILIEKETKPIIEEYEKYYIITQGSGDSIETQTKILRSNEESYD